VLALAASYVRLICTLHREEVPGEVAVREARLRTSRNVVKAGGGRRSPAPDAPRKLDHGRETIITAVFAEMRLLPDNPRRRQKGPTPYVTTDAGLQVVHPARRLVPDLSFLIGPAGTHTLANRCRWAEAPSSPSGRIASNRTDYSARPAPQAGELWILHTMWIGVWIPIDGKAFGAVRLACQERN